ncbi:MAG: class I SAM-dependent methyltransferase [Spirochaetota bacterium]
MQGLELLVDFHRQGLRQGPGDDTITQKALAFLDLDTKQKLSIADIGCGTGAQTMCLAGLANANITAIDLFPEFLQELETRAKEQKPNGVVQTVQASMEDLPFPQEQFDVMWSEGAIYIMGFEKGIKAWREYLKPKGYLAVTEISWLTSSRPKELNEYWQSQYPEISAISEKVQILERHGYSPIATFQLPESCWLDKYYLPMQKRMDSFLQKHRYSPEARELVENEMEEIQLYNTYKQYYGYVFYIAQKIFTVR